MTNFSIKIAYQTQFFLSQKSSKKTTYPQKIRTIAGVDVSYLDEVAVGVLTVLDYD
jgi:deoxyinosine 3'endonuclease (endonuclease V)